MCSGIRVCMLRRVPKCLSTLSRSTAVTTSVGCLAWGHSRSWTLYWWQESQKPPRARCFSAKWSLIPVLRWAGRHLAAPDCPGRLNKRAEKHPVNTPPLMLPQLSALNNYHLKGLKSCSEVKFTLKELQDNKRMINNELFFSHHSRLFLHHSPTRVYSRGRKSQVCVLALIGTSFWLERLGINRLISLEFTNKSYNFVNFCCYKVSCHVHTAFFETAPLYLAGK